MIQCEQCSVNLEDGWQWPLCGDCLTGANAIVVECKCGHSFEVENTADGRIAQCPECMRTVPVVQHQEEHAAEQPEPFKEMTAEERYQRDRMFRDLVDVLEEWHAAEFEQAMALAIQHHKQRRIAGPDVELPDNSAATGDVTAAILR